MVRTLGLKGLELIAMLEQAFKLEFGVSGVVLGLAGGEGLAIPRQREGIDGKEPEEIVLAQRRDEGPLIEFEADGNRLPVEPRAQGAHPRIDGVWRCSRTLHSRVSEPAACRQISCLASAQSMPMKAANSSVGRRVMCHLL